MVGGRKTNKMLPLKFSLLNDIPKINYSPICHLLDLRHRWHPSYCPYRRHWCRTLRCQQLSTLCLVVVLDCTVIGHVVGAPRPQHCATVATEAILRPAPTPLTMRHYRPPLLSIDRHTRNERLPVCPNILLPHCTLPVD